MLKMATAMRPVGLTYHILNHLKHTHRCQLWTSAVFNAKAKDAAKAKMMAQMTERKRMEVETDPEKLVNFVCGANIYTKGQDPAIRPDSEYPAWLWALQTKPGATPLEEMDKDSHQYWRNVKRHERAKQSLLKKTKHKFQIFGRPIIKDKL